MHWKEIAAISVVTAIMVVGLNVAKDKFLK